MRDRKDIFAVFLILLVISASCLPLFINIQNINLDFDWLQMASYYHFARQCILEFHELPLWAHYFGGGYPVIANPQEGTLNPFVIPPLVFGEIAGLKINVLLAHFIAAFGMYYLTRKVLKYHYLGALFSTFAFTLGGYMHRLLIRGQDYIPSFYFFFLPLLLALFLKARQDKRFLIYAAFVLSIVLSQAGLYFAPIALFIFLFVLLASDGKPLKDFFIICVLALFLGAVKILPMIEILRQNPRIMESYNPFWPPIWEGIYKGFFVTPGFQQFPGAHWKYFYLGYVPVTLALLSFLFYWRQTRRFFVLFVIFFLFSFFAKTRLDLFWFLSRLPAFHSIEAPMRYFLPPVIFLIALCAGRNFDYCDKVKNKVVLVLFAVVPIFVTADLFKVNSTTEISFIYQAPAPSLQKDFFTVKNSRMGNKVSPYIPKTMFLTRAWEWTRPTQYELMLQNIGKVNWYGNVHLKENAVPKYFIDWNNKDSFDAQNLVWRLNPDYKGEVWFLSSPANNTARMKQMSPNRMLIEVNVAEVQDTLIINQNYDRDWRANILGLRATEDGLLALPLGQKGAYEVRLVYVPKIFYIGFFISLATLIALILALRKMKKEGQAQ